MRSWWWCACVHVFMVVCGYVRPLRRINKYLDEPSQYHCCLIIGTATRTITSPSGCRGSGGWDDWETQLASLEHNISLATTKPKPKCSIPGRNWFLLVVTAPPCPRALIPLPLPMSTAQGVRSEGTLAVPGTCQMQLIRHHHHQCCVGSRYFLSNSYSNQLWL